MPLYPEARFLLACAKSYITGEHRDDLSVQGLDWTHLLHIASRHKIAPLLYQVLSVTYRNRVPEEVLNRLRDLYRTNAARSFVMAQELVQLLELFKGSDIPAIPFKGPVLAACLYGDVSLRQFADLDILIRERDLDRAAGVLDQRGYFAGAKLAWEQQFRRDPAKLDFTVDLHWSITHKNHCFPRTPEYLWERRESKVLFDKTIAVLGGEETLLMLCFNGAKDGWTSLSLVCDIAKLMGSANTIDWIGIVEKSRRWGCRRIVLLGLYLASDLAGAALPPVIRQAISSDRAIPRLAAQVEGRLFEENHPDSWEARAYLRQARMRERLREKVTFYGCMWSAMIAPNESDGAVLRSTRQLVYYSTRPLWRIAKRGVIAYFDVVGKGSGRN